MPDLPTYVWPFIFAVVAAVAGRIAGGRAAEEPDSLPRILLYAVAAACVVVGFVMLWLDRTG